MGNQEIETGLSSIDFDDELIILVVNNYGQFCHLIHRTVRDLDMNAQIVKNTLCVDELIAYEPHGIILSGGPDIKRAGNCVQYIKDVDVPVLGICLGHQLIAKAFEGEVETGTQGGYASVSVQVIEEDEILKGLGPTINTWASHADKVSRMPDGFVQLARSDICEIEAMKHPDRPIYGVQWHPEVSHTQNGEELFLNFLNICKKA